MTIADGRVVHEEMKGFLVLEDGTVFRGESVGAEGFAFGEAVFTTGDDRLPGGRHRPELRRADRLLHGADGRQLRRRRRRSESGHVRARRDLCARHAARPGRTGWSSARSRRCPASIRARLSSTSATVERCAPPSSSATARSTKRWPRSRRSRRWKDGRSPLKSRRATRTSPPSTGAPASRSSTTAASARSSAG